MSRLKQHQQALYELRFSPMTKPANEVAGLTQLESHTTRARTMIFWRVAAGLLQWGPREVEILYESTLDNISKAFDVFAYPIDRYMLDARADVWDAGLAPDNVLQAVAASESWQVDPPPTGLAGGTLLLGGELAAVRRFSPLLMGQLEDALSTSGIDAAIWVAPTGAVPYVLGARDTAARQAQQVVTAIRESGATTLIVDGPETAWMLEHIYPELGHPLIETVALRLLSELLVECSPSQHEVPVFVHDSRPAYELATQPANNLAVMPGYQEDEADFGQGSVYDAPRHLVDAAGMYRVSGTWIRGLARTSGADDGLWLTYPKLAAGLARQRLDYAREQGAELIVTDSPLAVAFLTNQREEGDLPVVWLPALLLEDGLG